MRNTWRVLATLLVCAAALAAGKGGGRETDVLLEEGFEDPSWALAWTVVDADGSGGSWARLGEDQYYTPHSGDFLLGSRYREDGLPNDDWLISPALRPSELRHIFSIHYRSQDPDWAETVEFLALRVDRPLAAGELVGSLASFELLTRQSAVPATWQKFEWDMEDQLDRVWYFAVRNVSQDRFVLVVDDAAGCTVLPSARHRLEEQYRRFDFGLLRQDSLAVRPFRIWNLDAADTLEMVVHHRPQAPFLRSNANATATVEGTPWDSGSSLFLHEAPQDTTEDPFSQDSLHINFGARSFSVLDGDTTRYFGAWKDSLLFDVFHHDDGAIESFNIPFTVAFWAPDSLARLDLFEDFEEETSWTREVGDASDTLGWSLGSFTSSSNFSVPLRSRFAFVNSDARGRFTGTGLPLTQDAWLLSPWLDVSRTRDGAQSRGLLLGWDQVFVAGAGGSLSILADSAGTGWREMARPDGSTGWESRSLDLSALAGTDSLRLAFRFQGSWSYGAALDDLVLLAVADELPGAGAPELPERPGAVEVRLAPNPFNPVTVVRWQAAGAGRLDVRVYNLLGQQVMERGPLLLRPGANQFPLDFGPLASGTYLVRMLATDGDGRVTQVMRKVSYLK